MFFWHTGLCQVSIADHRSDICCRFFSVHAGLLRARTHTPTHTYEQLSVSELDVERGLTSRGQSGSQLMIWLKCV